MAEGPASALPLMESLKLRGDLDEYHLFHSSRAELLRRLGRFDEAADSYARALTLAGSEDERRFLERRLLEVQGGPRGRSTTSPES